MNRCPKCSSNYDDDARFCTRDGARLEPAPPSSVKPWLGAVTPAKPSYTIRRARAESTPVPPVSLLGQVLQGRYEVVRKVGEGGMSVVYLAIDVATRERHAIKVLSATLSHDANAMARLRREASLGMRLAHPNICHIMRLGETDTGLVFVVMPFLEGELLADRTTRLGRLGLAETVRLVRDIAEGLQLAHQLKIIHRDLKPENVMVTQNADGSERGVVMDFGLAKERRADPELQRLTATGIILGTPEFMSPEQLRGRPIDGRTDIYALALMAFEMLTGRLPFQGRTQQEVMIARLRSEPMALRTARADLDYTDELQRVFAKALQRSPDERYQTAPQFAEALAAAAGGQSDASVSGGSPEGKLLGKLFGR
jgi:serine/threonine protein kinase